MLRRQRFVAGAIDWTPTWPTRVWSPIDRTAGQTRITASGVPDGERLTQDALLTLSIRAEEGEWPELEALILYGLTSQVITWYPDADDPSTSFEVWLETPAPGESWTPNRPTDFPHGFDLEVTLRGAFGGIPWLEFFP